MFASRRGRDGAAMRLGAVAFAVAGLMGCTKAQLGLPRTALSVPSPDGRFVAEVRNHPTIDPPNQTIWVGEVAGGMHEIEHLFPDMDNCHDVAWSGDSSTVAFVIRRGRLRVVRAADRRTVFNDWVVEWHGEYPPALEIRDLTLSADGTRARFRACQRNGDCSAFRTIDISGGSSEIPS